MDNVSLEINALSILSGINKETVFVSRDFKIFRGFVLDVLKAQSGIQSANHVPQFYVDPIQFFLNKIHAFAAKDSAY